METIKMLVMAINEDCANCPELEIDIDRYTYSDLCHQDTRNALYCKHYRKCEKIYEAAMKAAKEETGG